MILHVPFVKSLIDWWTLIIREKKWENATSAAPTNKRLRQVTPGETQPGFPWQCVWYSRRYTQRFDLRLAVAGASVLSGYSMDYQWVQVFPPTRSHVASKALAHGCLWSGVVSRRWSVTMNSSDRHRHQIGCINLSHYVYNFLVSKVVASSYFGSYHICKVRYILSSVCLRLCKFSQLYLCVFSLLIYLVIIVRICVLYLIIIIKSEVWTISSCLWLSHPTMLRAACLAIFSWRIWVNCTIINTINSGVSHVMCCT